MCPEIDDWTSLWECLHDAYVLSINHDALEGTAVVELKLGFPAATESGVTTETATIRFGGTSRIFLYIWHRWPGPNAEHRPGMSNEEWNLELDAWTKKGCVQTVMVEDFNEALSDDEAYILEARGSFASDRCVIEFDGCFNGGESFNAFIVGDKVSVDIDGLPSNMDELLSKGKSAWAAFNSK